MLRSLDVTTNLKNDILELKKELSVLKNENHLLKVKVRKLQNEISKKDKQIEILIDPDKSFLIKKVVSEKGASMIITLRDRIKKMEKAIGDKDGVIRKLQNDLQTKKLYTLNSADKRKSSAVSSNKFHLSIPFFENECDFECELKSICKSASLDDLHKEEDESKLCKTSDRRSPSTHGLESHKKTGSGIHDVKAQYEGLPRSHLLSIIENLKSNQQRLSPVRRLIESPESDLERCELQCETPHLEIQQLQNYFMDILDEVDHLKVTISTLKNEQEKTSNILKEKDSSIEYLAKEIECLRKPLNTSTTDLMESKSSFSDEQEICFDGVHQQRSSSLNIDLLQSDATQTFKIDFLCANQQQNTSIVDKQQMQYQNVTVALVTKEEKPFDKAEARKEKFYKLLKELSV